MHKLALWISLTILLFFSSLIYAQEKAIQLNIDGPIGPAVQDYVKRGIIYADTQHAGLIILQINTPGGLESAMRNITQSIIASPVPVIAYVAPSGARAASAGTFIVYASQLAAMAPGTNIGAASPVNLLGGDDDKKSLSTRQTKAVNDAAAYIRSLAQINGRNAEWAEQAVREGVSLSAEEAKKLKVINDIAKDTTDLLQKMDGQTVTLHGVANTISTQNLQLEQVPHDWKYAFLNFVTNPNIAYLLFLIAIYGLFFEFSSPGMILPGVAGVIALLLVLYAFQLMPINYTGLTLIMLGVVFMILEIYISSFGALGIGGVIAFVLGSVLLFDVNDPHYKLALTLIFIMSALTLLFFLTVLNLAIRSHKKQVVTGQEGLIGSEGTVLSMMNRQIVVQVLGEVWEAETIRPVVEGDKVKIIAVNGLKLTVEPVKKTHCDINEG